MPAACRGRADIGVELSWRAVVDRRVNGTPDKFRSVNGIYLSRLFLPHQASTDRVRLPTLIQAEAFHVRVHSDTLRLRR